ncbi:Hypothetical_protein [Hexamita inflata]|uniref:Hypothetical_protein n=1 Tax=Hexamita inflata TaxID=28002 RepID=A0AA86QHS5_9EUKA|nr:Hypothetical protein HINF_LOCUS16088 [Hexamita inflata]CAI9954888.1 Hypothetical protein HINF_LOCUS42533 [Hexamita inflata]
MLHQIFAGYSSAKHIQSGRVLASDNQVSRSPTRDGPHFLIFKFYIFDSRKSNFWKSSSVCELDQAVKRICKLIKQPLSQFTVIIQRIYYLRDFSPVFQLVDTQEW